MFCYFNFSPQIVRAAKTFEETTFDSIFGKRLVPINFENLPTFLVDTDFFGCEAKFKIVNWD